MPGKSYARVLERRCRGKVEPQLLEEQCGFRAGRSTADQLCTLRRVVEASWEFGQTVYAAFVDLEKAYDRVPRPLLWETMAEYGIDGRLLASIRSLYHQSRSCVRLKGCLSERFDIGVGLRQGCVLSPLLFTTFMDRICRRSNILEGMDLGGVRVGALAFADDLAILAPSRDRLQAALDRFAEQCSSHGMRISVAKTEVMAIGRTPGQCRITLGGKELCQVDRFKYLGVEFSEDGTQEREISRRIGAAGAVLRAMKGPLWTGNSMSEEAKLAVYCLVYCPTLVYGHENWVLDARNRSRVEATEMRFLRMVAGVSLREHRESAEIRLGVRQSPLILTIERSQLRWLGHVLRMPEERLTRQALLARPEGTRPVGRPRTTWTGHIKRLLRERLDISWDDAMESSQDRRAWRGVVSLSVHPPTRKETRGNRR